MFNKTKKIVAYNGKNKAAETTSSPEFVSIFQRNWNRLMKKRKSNDSLIWAQIGYMVCG